MGQREHGNDILGLDWFACETPLGWLGVLGREKTVHRLWIGHASRNQLQKELDSWASENSTPIREHEWWPNLKSRLIAYTRGETVDFSDVAVHDPRSTPFQKAVLKATRNLKFGCVKSYGEIATLAGKPGAARAVGTVMSGNPVPLIVPCHRVVAASGKLGGYTSPQGVQLKERLLALEQAR